MRRRRLLLMLLSGVPRLLSADEPVAGKAAVYGEPRHALVVGIESCAGMTARYALRDAADIAGLLERRWFEVTVLTNANKRQIDSALMEFTSRLGHGGVGVFYFAGYGCRNGGRNFILPSDADPGRGGDVSRFGVSVDGLLEGMSLASNRLNLVFLDACRPLPPAAGDGTNAQGFSGIRIPNRTVVFCSAETGRAIEDGAGASNSLLAACLLDAAARPGEELLSVMRNFSSEFAAATGGRSRPWVSGSLCDGFHFTPRGETDARIWLEGEDLRGYRRMLLAQYRSGYALRRREKEEEARVGELNARLAKLLTGEDASSVALAIENERAASRRDKERLAGQIKALQDELEPLRAAEAANRKQGFASEYQAYLDLGKKCEEGVLPRKRLTEAWQGLCRRWAVDDGGDGPGRLRWDDAQGQPVYVFAGGPPLFKGWYVGRDPKRRAGLVKRGGGSEATERAVLNALRWLKKTQNADGSWPNTKPAMTGLALLAFLARGETPASAEFGKAVDKGIRFLLEAQTENGHFKGADGHEYSHPIATLALCEAYGMTGDPAVRKAAAGAIDVIIAGQHASGGFNYNFNQDNRDDTSYMGWCVQALKAAETARVMNDPAPLKKALERATDGFRKNYSDAGGDDANPVGGFGYTAPGVHGLTATGALCMQMLGAAQSREVKGALNTMAGWTFEWNKADYGGTLYYAYYTTQAKFHMGGERWSEWNRQFSPALCKNQAVVAGAIEDAQGNVVDIGYWDSSASGHADAGEGKRVMTTCLCALMLQVYYRNMPTPAAITFLEEDRK